MTNKQHGILGALKNLAFEEEPESAEPTSEAAHSAVSPAEPAAQSPLPSSYTQAIDAGIVADNDQVYKTILSKTDFERTDVATAIRKFLQPLAAIADSVMPPNVKFKSAVLQAKAQAGLSESDILATFDTLKTALQQEQDSFAAKAHQFEAREITGRQNRITQVTAQITQLQQELSQLSTELVDAQGKAAHAQAQFSAAVQRRSGEIEQQRAQYTALLKG